MRPLMLGVELEYRVKNHPGFYKKFAVNYNIYNSSMKGSSIGKIHPFHGDLVESVHLSTGGLVEIHYDATASEYPNGWELVGKPFDLHDNLSVWSGLFTSAAHPNLTNEVTGFTPFGRPLSCGMHVHVSGIDLGGMKTLILFMNSENNSHFLEKIAGRHASFYCNRKSFTEADVETLFHRVDCTYPGNQGKKIVSPSVYCCESVRLHKNNISRNYWKVKSSTTGDGSTFERLGLNVLPRGGTGDFEIRIFHSPMELSTFKARLQFAQAITDYAMDLSRCDEEAIHHSSFLAWMMAGTNRTKYSDLFKYLRSMQLVKGLIPKNGTPID